MAKKQIEQTEIEAPYELPEGWKWVPLLEAFENKTSSQKKIPTNEYLENGKYAIVDQGQDFIGGYTNDETKVFDEDLPVIIFGDHTKCIKYIDFPFAQGADGVKVLKSKKEIDSKFLYYGLKSIPFPDLGYRRHFPMFKNFTFPLPPTLEEQQRIVNRIETLFAKLDQTKEKAQNVVDTFETRKASILHKAFTGELTKKWREENDVGEDSWVEKLFFELGKSNLGKMLDAKKNTGSDVLYLRNVNVRWFDFDLTDLLTMKAKDEEIEKLSVKKGDLFICEGGEPGRCAVWKEEDSNIIFQKAIHRFKPNNNVSSDFIAFSLFYLNSIGQLSNYFTGTTIKHLTGQSLAKIKISLPSLPEQTEIVRILDTILGKEIKAKEAAEAVLEQIDLLKKSILARAFRGEL